MDFARRPPLHVGRRLLPRAHDHPKATPDVHQGTKLSSSPLIAIYYLAHSKAERK